MAIALALVAIADLAIKHAIVTHIQLDERIVLIPHWLWLHYVHNYRGAMGLFGQNESLLVVLAIIVLVVLGCMLRDAIVGSALAQIAFGMIAGGAVGNLIDRVSHGYVIDYLSVRSFYIFNFADACISIGTGLLVIDAFRRKQLRA
ncbi:MAG TPA: signal peptidase II [Candidatus Acidoferrales bacterium]|nr:signal peptidase II [Candidatus Acidoferrales bacterium]